MTASRRTGIGDPAAPGVYPSRGSFSVWRANHLRICLVFLEPRSSKLVPVRYNSRAATDLGEG